MNQNDNTDKAKFTEDCKEYGEKNRVSSYLDCSKLNNEEKKYLCCYLTGINHDKSTYNGCIAVNILFKDKFLSYESSTISGKLICQKDYSFSNFLKHSFITIFLVVLFIF